MAFHCGHCSSTKTTVLLDARGCEDCGEQTREDGTALVRGRSTETLFVDRAAKPQTDPEPRKRFRRRA